MATTSAVIVRLHCDGAGAGAAPVDGAGFEFNVTVSTAAACGADFGSVAIFIAGDDWVESAVTFWFSAEASEVCALERPALKLIRNATANKPIKFAAVHL
jgi:hypothetical protein